VFGAAFLYLECVLLFTWQRDVGEKAAYKMLAKLGIGLNFTTILKEALLHTSFGTTFSVLSVCSFNFFQHFWLQIRASSI